MLIATLIAAASLNTAPVAPVAAAPWSVTCSVAAGRPNNCLPHADAAKTAPKQAAASRIVCHPDPTKSIACFQQKARKAADERAAATRGADEA